MGEHRATEMLLLGPQEAKSTCRQPVNTTRQTLLGTDTARAQCCAFLFG